MEDLTLAAGILLFLGVLGGRLANLLKLPAVTGYIVAGLIMGPSVLDLFPEPVLDNLEPITNLGLGIIALTIAGELNRKRLREVQGKVPPVFVAESLLTFVVVGAVIYLISGSLPLALVLGVLSLATAPAAIVSILRECKAQGEFPRVLMPLVAMDNLLCIVGFSLVVPVLQVLYFGNPNADRGLLLALFGDLGLAIGLGAALGLVLVYLSLRSLNDDMMTVFDLGTLLLAVGVAQRWGLPALLVAMVMGIVVANLSPQPRRIFRLVEQVEFPILVGFLTLAGVKLNLGLLGDVGLLAVGYIVARLLGKILGARLGAARSPKLAQHYRTYLGLALTPQAGVAIGLALLAEQQLPLEPGVIITLILSTVIFFELLGPILVKWALDRCQAGDEPVVPATSPTGVQAATETGKSPDSSASG